MITVLFPDTSKESISEIVNVFNLYGSKYGLNKSIRVAHFLAQVREEVGSKFRPLRENLNYKEEAVLKMFKNFTPDLAEKYARDNDTPVADQVAIANIAYAGKLGNGEADTDKDGQLDEDDDGYKYRGAGVLQITGKSNFIEVQNRINKYSPEANINILAGRDADSLTGSILMGMAFWVWKDLYKLADAGTSKQVVDSITAVINKYTSSYKSRQEHFKKIKEFI